MNNTTTTPGTAAALSVIKLLDSAPNDHDLASLPRADLEKLEGLLCHWQQIIQQRTTQQPQRQANGHAETGSSQHAAQMLESIAHQGNKATRDLLGAIADGVFVIADDIPIKQQQEMQRELRTMGALAESFRRIEDWPNVPRSSHLQRGES